MTGLERLRKLANDLCYDAADVSLFDMLEQGNETFWGVSYKRDSTLRETLFAIAKQIEREHSQACEDHERQQEIIRDLQRERDDALREAKLVREQGGAEELDRSLMSKDDADWVGQYGGINGVRDALSNDSAIVLTVINKLWPDGAPDGIAGNDDIAAELDRRLMPPGMEWPRFEDDAPVKFGDVALIDGYADMVEAIQLWIHGRPVIYGDGGSQQLESGERVKRPKPAPLAHTKPEPSDSWEQLEDDATMPPEAYCVGNGLYNQLNELDDFSAVELFARDLVRRAKALAERERGE